MPSAARMPFAQARTRAMKSSTRVKLERSTSPLSPPPSPPSTADDQLPATKRRRMTRSIKRDPSPLNGVKPKEEQEASEIKVEASLSAAEKLRERKLKGHRQFASEQIFPDFARPTGTECKLAHNILQKLHGERIRPDQVVASTTRAGCGDSPSVLDALVRTILSQNTSDVNSSRAKRSMDKAYGSSDNWSAVAEEGEEKLEESIRCGGLSKVKSRVIISILNQVQERYGKYSLDHLHAASTEDAMSELLSFKGVGPKTASCVLLFCLRRADFAVDTHVHRITGLLGWRPAKANREQTYAHLNQRIPDEDKYGLHILLVTHGKRCDECKAGGRNTGKCELRRAFKQKVADVKAEDGSDGIVKDEQGLELIKDELPE